MSDRPSRQSLLGNPRICVSEASGHNPEAFLDRCQPAGASEIVNVEHAQRSEHERR